jgi:hypothetical protein
MRNSGGARSLRGCSVYLPNSSRIGSPAEKRRLSMSDSSSKPSSKSSVDRRLEARVKIRCGTPMSTASAEISVAGTVEWPKLATKSGRIGRNLDGVSTADGIETRYQP